MDYVDLERCFVPIGKDQEAYLDPEIGKNWGRKYMNWLDWSDLLEHSRVVLLAEASCGKTEEFRHQVKTLSAQGRAAFFVSVEELVDGFEAALEPSAVQTFERWHDRSDEEGWFFLDSVDEARLHSKKCLEKALKCLARELDREMERARIYLSCRETDWKDREDSAAVQRLLPLSERPDPLTPENDEAALLNPIFKDPFATDTAVMGPERKRVALSAPEEPERKQNALLVVRIVPLNTQQRRLLAEASGIDRVDAFIEGIDRNNLNKLTERPGDILYLAEYWKKYDRFGSLAEMIDHGVSHKLKEMDSHRPDSGDLPDDKARHGAERLAAALTFSKSFTLRSPGQEPDPTLAAGALDPADVLKDWTEANRNALLRRGVFVPSTYGRVRFHHRDTQEYLTASWMQRLLQEGCPLTDLKDLIFAKFYGVETVVPSLHATAAWLALDHPEIREEIIRREPLVLLHHGDPRSLPLVAKENLLLSYAARHQAGEISDNFIGYRELSMFATSDLASTIVRAWKVNGREGFRIHLLHLVEEGAIQACTHLAQGVVLDETYSDDLRVAALQAVAACGDTKGLVEAARWLKSASDRVDARLGPGFAKILFPRHLTVDELLHLISCSPVPKGPLDGFGIEMLTFWEACPSSEDREQLLVGLADLSLSPPFKSTFERISLRHHELVKKLTPLAQRAVVEFGGAGAPEGLIRLLMAVERADRYFSAESEGPSISSLISTSTDLQRRLFWADIEETRQHTKHPLTHLRQISIRDALWKLGPGDLDWLFADFRGRSLKDDKRIVLRAILGILRDTGKLDDAVHKLRELVSGEIELDRYLEPYLAPTLEDKKLRALRLKEQRQQLIDEERQRTAKKSWIKFREEVTAAPSLLCDPNQLTDWDRGAFRLYYLTNWLCSRTKKHRIKEATLQWKLLQEAFGRTVAEAYRDGMKALWRVTQPERPIRKNGSGVTSKHTTVMSFSGIGIEAAEDTDWARGLKPADVERAALHACLSEQGYPEWFEELVDRHGSIVVPILRQVFREEWSSHHSGNFLYYYSRTGRHIQNPVQRALFDVVTGEKPVNLRRLDVGLRILQRLDLNEAQRRTVARLARRRIRGAQSGVDDEHLWRYLAILFLVDADGAALAFANWLESLPPPSPDARAEGAFATLFGKVSALLDVTVLGTMSVACLEDLVRSAFRYVRLEDDRVHEGIYSPDTRDDAESARNHLITALENKPGADAYQAMQRLATDEALRSHAIRLKELAHGKAERDAEQPAWTPAEVLAFERHYVAPAKTGESLLRVVMSVLVEIQSSFTSADATSRAMLERAMNEDEVQEWLAEQLNLRSQKRFHAHREAQVARRDKPDLIVSSTAAQLEVAVEVKHGGKKWSVRDLEQSLTKQLAIDYLKPPTRRWGVLVVSYHGGRTWRDPDPDTRETLDFYALISRLQERALTVESNEVGAVKVRVFGLDASRR